MSEQVVNPGSFRDPSGFVYESGGRLFRSLDERGWDMVRSEAWQSFAGKLVASQKLVQFTITEGDFELHRLPWITYPYEWSPRQLRAAALLTLEIQIAAIDQGLSLKDASAFNVQFDAARPVFIDHLSIEPDPGTPWVAYRQFIEHFFAPLVLAEYVSPCIPWDGVTGVSIPTASAILGNRGRWNLAVQIHIHQLAKHLRPGEPGAAKATALQPLSQRKAILLQLQDAISKMNLSVPATNWEDYYATTNYSSEQAGAKDQLVRQWLQTARPKNLVDLGANTGKFSTMASEEGISVLAIESDLSVVNRVAGDLNCNMICSDLVDPDGGRGWMSEERLPLLQRAKADGVLALAIIHHLVLTGQVPLPRVVAMIASLAPKALIEWIEPDDSYVQRLIGGREVGLHAYDRPLFESCLSARYSEFRPLPIPGTKRVLYECSC